MLYRILKSLQKAITGEARQIEFSSDLKLTLSFIESGCLPASLRDKIVFIFKLGLNDIEFLKQTDQIVFEFECIKRPEFPSVRMNFEFDDKQNKAYRFDYFFNIESDEDMELLGKLEAQDYLDLIFLDSKIEYSKRIEITKKDKEKIKAVLDEAQS
ncbi:MAG: hypothetical protein ACRENF_04890 [Thermodesulfobacteriota bacterium]